MMDQLMFYSSRMGELDSGGPWGDLGCQDILRRFLTFGVIFMRYLCNETLGQINMQAYPSSFRCISPPVQTSGKRIVFPWSLVDIAWFRF
jgi:hypothetical protein